MTEEDKGKIKEAILISISQSKNCNPLELAELACKAIDYINDHSTDKRKTLSNLTEA